jgi:hypothetical protein
MAMATSRIAVMASYGLQQVQLHAGDSAWAPGFTATHLFEGGVIFFPTATASIRLGVAGAMGRHTTAFSGGLEWEACNLLDRGCEFSGSPDHKGEVLGGQTLPGYLRMDLGVRKHWHLTLRGRDAELGVFGTITNVVNRRNVMGWSRDAASTLVPVEMRPLAPLVAGLDWRF